MPILEIQGKKESLVTNLDIVVLEMLFTVVEMEGSLYVFPLIVKLSGVPGWFTQLSVQLLIWNQVMIIGS